MAKNKKVISHNQSGGITGYNVNVKVDNTGTNHKRKKKDSWYWNRIAKVVYVLATIIIPILSYFGIKPYFGTKPQEKEMRNEEDKEIKVTSYNQSGGITAYNVNIGPQDRKLSSDYTSQIDNFISQNPDKKIVITAVMGDQEAIRFASQIKKYLESLGCKPEGVNQAIYKEQMSPQNIKITDSRIDIIIGGKQ